jgi:hypothetical protein
LKYNNDIIKILDKGEAYYAGMVGKWVLRKKPVRFILDYQVFDVIWLDEN